MDELCLTTSMNSNRERMDSATVIQQSDVSSSRPALLAHETLRPLLFEVFYYVFFFILFTFFFVSSFSLLYSTREERAHRDERQQER